MPIQKREKLESKTKQTVYVHTQVKCTYSEPRILDCAKKFKFLKKTCKMIIFVYWTISAAWKTLSVYTFIFDFQAKIDEQLILFVMD